jgi:streptomycin 6-kinase
MSFAPVELPAGFRQRITGAFGDDGERWLADLPRLLENYAQAWSLSVGQPFDLSYNYVAPATRADGTLAVLKLGCPDPESTSEAEALRLFAGNGVCALLEYVASDRVMLLERVLPGTPLTSTAMRNDKDATAVFIDVASQLWQPAPEVHGFPTVAKRASYLAGYRARFGGGSGPLPEQLLSEAESMFAWLLSTSECSMLLHGDLHHDNILCAGHAQWLVIDPKGVVGDPGYDLGAFLYNPIPDLLSMPDPVSVIDQRLDQLSEGLDMDRSRVRGWGFAQAVLSACWSIDDGIDHSHSLTCAEILSSLSD